LEGAGKRRSGGDGEQRRWGAGEAGDTRKYGNAEMWRWRYKGKILNSQFSILNSQFPIPFVQHGEQSVSAAGRSPAKQQMTNDK